jgi:hypothetical protein
MTVAVYAWQDGPYVTVNVASESQVRSEVADPDRRLPDRHQRNDKWESD